MWKAYGLVYKLLQNGIPLNWAIVQTKTSTTDIDFTVSSSKDKRTGTALGSWDYRGGAFIIDSANAAAALPIISAWWAAKGNLPNVHEALAGFSADVNIVLRSAPRIANEAINSGITIAYYNAAGIPDSNGNAWSSAVAQRPRPDRDRGRRLVQPGQRLPPAQVRRLRHAAQQRLRLLAVRPDQPRHQDLLPARYLRPPGRRLDGSVPLDPEQ